MDAAWKDFLLNQFHDVLPGTSIELVQFDAWALYETIFTNLMTLRNYYHRRHTPTGDERLIYNPLAWPVNSVVFMNPDSGNPPTGAHTQEVTLDDQAFDEQPEGRYRVPNTFTAALVNLSASGYTAFAALEPANPVTHTGKAFQLFKNARIYVLQRIPTIMFRLLQWIPLQSVQILSTTVLSNWNTQPLAPRPKSCILLEIM